MDFHGGEFIYINKHWPCRYARPVGYRCADSLYG